MRLCKWIFVVLSVTGVGSAQTTILVPSLATPTIQSGIDAAHNSDTVLVAPGVYGENIDFKGKAITVTSSAGAATTIIDGGGKSATVTFQSEESIAAIISGFTIRNGGPTASLTTAGGGIYINNAAPTIMNNVITANACNGVTVAASYVHLVGNTISGTLASSNASCFLSGSGVAIYGTISGFILAMNGGDFYSEIEGNTIESNVQASVGGGIYFGGSFRLRNNIIRNNMAGDGSAIYDSNAEQSYISQNLIYGNDSNGSATYRSAVVLDEGPTLHFGPFYGYFFSNTITGNSKTASSVQSTEMYLDYASPLLFFGNNIIVGTTTHSAFECATQHTRVDQMTFDHNDIYNSTGKAASGTCNFPAGQYGNISSDPLFVSPGTSDFHLQAGSPAVDSGETIDLTNAENISPGLLLPNTDLDGNARILDATTKGYAVPDMGAYELAGAADTYQTALSLVPGFANTAIYEQDSNYPEPFPLTAQATSPLGIPTGSVNFYADGTVFDTQPINANGTAVTNSKTLVPGAHVMWASYAGQGAFSPTDAPPFLVAVDSYTPTLTLTSSVNPSLVGQSVTFTVQITSDINQLGPIYLVDGPTTLATLTPDGTGKATYTTSTLTLGTHQINAVYQGDATHNAVTATLTQQVVNYYPTSMTISSSVNPSTVGQPVTFSAQVSSVSGIPSGSIAFSDGATPFATVAVDPTGKASTTISTLTLGNHTITASYAQTGTFAASSASLTQQVIVGTSITTLSVMPTSGVYGTNVSMTATVTGNPPSNTVPTGTASFYSNSTLLAKVTLANGVATFSTDTLPGGTDTITCTYSGDSNFQGSSCSGIPVTISSTTSSMMLTGTPNPAAPSTTITFTATLMANGAPLVGAQVTFTIDGTVIGTKTTSATGSVVYKSPGLDPGQHTILATFAGNSSASGSSATFTEEVLAATSTQLVVSPTSSTYGSSVGITATVTSTSASAAGLVPSGTVAFSNNGNPLATVTLSNGVASFSTSALPPGTDTITCTYSGDTNFSASSCNPVIVTVSAATPALTLISSANPTNALSPVSFTATLTGNGSPVAGAGIVFTVDGTPVGTINTNAQGVAVYNSPGLNAGQHIIRATFAGNASYGAQAATLTEQVNGVPTSTALSVSPNPGTQGQPVNFTITVTALSGTAACGGSAVLLDGTTQIASSPLVTSSSSPTASASVSLNSLSPGAHQIQAMYLPANGNCLASASAVQTISIVAPGLALNANPPSITIKTEHYGFLAVTVTSVANFVGTVQMSCGSSLPPYVTCTFDKSQFSVSANGTASSQLTLNTDAIPYFESSVDNSPSSGAGHRQFWLATLLPFSLLTMIGLSRRRKMQTALFTRLVLLILVGSLTAVGLAGCGSKYPGHASPGTYSIPVTVTGTSSGATTSVSQTLNINLTVTE